LRVTVPTRKRARLEQDITRRYLQIMEREKGEAVDLDEVKQE
jgi:hypothetical protein